MFCLCDFCAFSDGFARIKPFKVNQAESNQIKPAEGQDKPEE
jgi:hypothetical protein